MTYSSSSDSDTESTLSTDSCDSTSPSKENTPVQRRVVARPLSPPSPSRTIFSIGAPFPPLYRVTTPPPQEAISTSIPDTDCKADVDHSLSSSSLSSPLLLSASPVLAGAEKEDKEIELTKESTDQMFAERLLLMAQITDLVNDMEADIAIIRDTGWIIGNDLICTSIPPEFRGHLGAPNSYQKFLHDVDRRRIAIETESIPYMPSDRVSKLPQRLRKQLLTHCHASLAPNTLDLMHPSLVIRHDHLLLVAPDEAVLSQHGDLQFGAQTQAQEVIVKQWGYDHFMYVGSFKPKTWWLPFNEEVTGLVDELHRDWTQHRNRVEFQELRIQSRRIRNPYRFCVLECVGFNKEYFDDLQKLSCGPF